MVMLQVRRSLLPRDADYVYILPEGREAYAYDIICVHYNDEIYTTTRQEVAEYIFQELI